MRFKFTYFYLILALIILLLLPKSITERMRGYTAYAVSPLGTWNSPKKGLEKVVRDQQNNINELESKNYLLKKELEERIAFDQQYQCLEGDQMHLLQSKEENYARLISSHLSALAVKPLYKPHGVLKNCLWINAGEQEGVLLYSPVVIGANVVGMVEFVDTNRSCVRLLKDPNFSIAARVVRIKEGESIFLAKGLVQGSVSKKLKGEGFNYDFVEDLKEEPLLLEKGDFVITSGLDGVFPSGLLIGKVSKVYPLKEGDYTISLDIDPEVDFEDPFTLLFIFR
jgi:rod shape-determining protein MreC